MAKGTVNDRGEVTVECKYEDKIIGLCENMATLVERIEVPISAIDRHINHGHVWRTAVAGLVLTVVINVVVFSNMFGKLSQMVANNSAHISDILEINERMAILEGKVKFIEEIIIAPVMSGDNKKSR